MATPAVIAKLNRAMLRCAPFVFVGLLPAALLGLGVARFILNHFFARAPYLLDSGFLSAIAYRSGGLLRTPKIACDYADSFYQVYVTPLMSLFSGISYLIPIHRIEWYAVVQALVYAPVALAVYMIASRVEPERALRRLPVTMLAALTFAFSGVVLWTIGYPHYEIATAGLVCILLACVVTGRTRLTWLVLLLIASVRQDGGLHAAVTLAPVVFLQRRGVDTIPSRRRVLAVIGVAASLSFIAVACQNIFFHPADRLHEVYLGRPLYSHLTLDIFLSRLGYLEDHLKLILYPFLATGIIAAVARDPNYLLGWASTVPWLLFNLTAKDPGKAVFAAYVMSPFVVGMFWVLVYGSMLAPREKRFAAHRVEALFAIVCFASILGYVRESRGWSHDPIRDMVISHTYDRSALHRFVDVLATHPAELGRVYVDDPAAALALEAVRGGDHWQPTATDADTLVFHRFSWERWRVFEYLREHELSSCVHVQGTGIVVCTRAPLSPNVLGNLPTEPFVIPPPKRRERE